MKKSLVEQFRESKKRKATFHEFMALAEQRGFHQLPADHPIFSEGPQITFVSDTPPGSSSARTPNGRNSIIEYFRVCEDGTLAAVGFRNTYQGQDSAYRFFNGMTFDDLRTLGVVVVEGRCPGDDTTVAELHEDIEAANRAAKASGISVRFRKARPRQLRKPKLD